MDKRVLRMGVGTLVLSVALMFAAGGCEMLGMGDPAGKGSAKDGKGSAKDGGGAKDGGASKVPDPPETKSEVKLPKSLWDDGEKHYAKDAKVGDFVVTEAAGNKMRRELIEKGDNFLVERTTMSVGGMNIKSSVKMIFSEPDPPEQKVDAKYTWKKGDEKVKVGDKEVDAQWIETYDGDKLIGKSWTSKEIPLGGMVKSTGADGKVVMQTVDFGRGK